MNVERPLEMLETLVGVGIARPDDVGDDVQLVETRLVRFPQIDSIGELDRRGLEGAVLLLRPISC